MKSHQTSQYLIPALFIPLILVALIVGTLYTFAVGTPRLTPTVSANSKPISSSKQVPKTESQYPDQAHITDGIIVFGIIIVATILFGIAWGRWATIRHLPKPGRK